ncbi:MAG: C1 family peptidase [Prevotellaceae bacterium]|nr:C1 family peptidase [Candidatus Colivivens caballi]
MKTKSIVMLTVLAGLCGQVSAQQITQQMLSKMRQENSLKGTDRAIRNALSVTDVSSLALSQDNQTEMNTYFSNSVPSKGITDQKSSGRCWLFSGLNVLRAQMINNQKLDEMTFSQVYLFFYDQLEKSNLFLQAIVDTKAKPIDDQTVSWLLQHPLSDGGTFTGVADLVSKYGLVPSGVMPENYTALNTSKFTSFMKRKLREDAILLRESNLKGQPLLDMKNKMLGEIYHLLVLGYGEPPTEFTWAPTDKNGNYREAPKRYTPLEFYHTMFPGMDLQNDYVMLMNDPTRDYWKTYEIQYDRHTYDGHNWKYINLPMDEIKKAAIASIKDSVMMYFSCDVKKELDSKRGLLDVNNYDYESFLGVKFGMDKRQRILTFDSGSTHAMTLMAVDLDADGKPLKWEVENSWGATSGYKGHLIITDKWMDEYMFRLVVNKKYLDQKVIKAAEAKPTMLPCWDPMYSEEE